MLEFSGRRYEVGARGEYVLGGGGERERSIACERWLRVAVGTEKLGDG